MRHRLCAFLIIVVLISSGCSQQTLLSRQPRPANFGHIWQSDAEGKLLKLDLNPKNIYGMGLTYATHMKETGSDFNPGEPPPVFKKSLSSLNIHQDPVKIPSREDVINSAESIEPGLGKELSNKEENIEPLLDYEGELAFVLLEDIDSRDLSDSAFAPKIGYFLINDLSARTLAILGEGRPNRYEYWGASKSFSGFLPVGPTVWIPNDERPDSVLSVVITTEVNGLIRQRQSTTDMMYTPREMLQFISKAYSLDSLNKSDIVLMGTPSGVAMQVLAWKAWVAKVLNLDRFTKLALTVKSAGANSKFLKSGDTVRVSSPILGSVSTLIRD